LMMLEMFNLFKDVSKDYRDKFRTLYQNINQVKNQALRDLLLSGEITATRLLTMTHEVRFLHSFPFVLSFFCLSRSFSDSILDHLFGRNWQVLNLKHNVKQSRNPLIKIA
jgi:hypothetical protein